jgi:ferric iron reductase protein FhuF
VSISENKKEVLLDLINQLENDLMDFLHMIEEDESIPDETFKRIDNGSTKPFSKLTALREEVYYS